MVHVLEKEPTTEHDGNVEYWHCNSCEKHFADAFGSTELSDAEISVPWVNDGMAKIVVDNSSGTAGDTVDVIVRIRNNPGVMGAIIRLEYDEGLTLNAVKNGDAFEKLTMTRPGKLESPCQFVWDSLDLLKDDIQDGAVLILTFKINDEIENGTELGVRISCNKNDVINSELKPLEIKTENGSVTVNKFKYGDVNNDTYINVTDVIMMRRLIAGGYEQEVIEAAADLNCDGSVNVTDIVLLRRYLAGDYGVDELPVGKETGE